MFEDRKLVWPLGVCVLPPPARNLPRTVSYPDYVHEILRHAGVCYTPVPVEALADALPGLGLLLTVGDAALPDAARERLSAWVERGGAWLSVGGLCGMESLFGARAEPPAYASWGGGGGTLGEGYLRFEASAAPPWLGSPEEMPLHFFNGVPALPAGGTLWARAEDAHQRSPESPRAAVLENTVGRGRCVLIAPDVTGAVVRIQQGIAVTRDGVPAPDGTAPIADAVLKSGDGGVMDWIFDREPVPGVPGFRAFLQPIADRWRALLLRAVFHLATEQQVPLPLLWLYPRNLPALAHLSHDTDGNDPAKAGLLLEALRAANVSSTWCTILPGYAPELTAAIRDAGHELAMHYDAMTDGCPWDEAAFDDQWRRLTELFGGEKPVTNKNHYLRWENDTELWAWCARRGIQLDQSKGASKTGEAGFNFGTCHPHFPVDFDGATLDVLELPTPTQDLTVFAPPALLAPLLDAAARHHGVLHLLFHPAHIAKPGVAEALEDAVRQARARGLEWWTARRINDWERARRQTAWIEYAATESGGARARLRVQTALPGATVLWLAPGDAGAIRLNGMERETYTVERWGFRFRAAVLDAAAESEIALEIGA